MLESRRATAVLLLLTLALPFVPGCGKQESSAPQATTTDAKNADTGKTIGLSVLTLTNPFFKDIADAMTEAAAEHGFTVTVVSSEFDAAKQQHQIDDFIVQKVAAIVLTPADSKAIGPAIRKANAAGVPVFTADIAVLDPEAKVVTHVATDNEEGGRQAAKAMLEALGRQGKVAIIDHPEVESVILRTKGFHEVIDEANEDPQTNIQIVATLPGGGAREKSFNVAEDLIQSHPDLNGIFAINDPSALGACAALERAGKADDIVVIGFDGMPEGKKAIRDGRIYADPIQFPDQIGRKTVEAIMSYLGGQTPPAQILIPTALYTKQDALADKSLEN